MGRPGKLLTGVTLSVIGLLVGESNSAAAFLTARQKALEEWRSLSSAPAEPPKVYVRNNHIRFYFQTQTNDVGFSAHWNRSRVPTDGYRVYSARLHLDRGIPSEPQSRRGWRPASIIAGPEWRQLSTKLLTALTPETPGHGFYYQGLLADRLLYRDALGQPRSAAIDQQPSDISVERHFSMQETLEILARLLEQQLSQTHPGSDLFVLMASDTRRLPQPLLLDRQQRQCVWLAPAALYDPTERGFSLAVTLRGISALLFESHGVALVKNPVSSATRVGDLGVETLIRLLWLRLPRPGTQPPPLSQATGMDLVNWETWLDRYTGTSLQDGSLQFLVDGEKFFPRLQQAISAATNHIHINVFIFDRDDMGVEIADELKRASGGVAVKVIMDQMGSLAAGTVLPSTPLPEHFVEPSSISSYLRSNSNVQVRQFLNPWFSADHSKLYLVDGTHAWLGGMNVGREYRYEWHDLMVELEGPVVGSLEKEFRREWAHEGPFGDLAYLGALITPPSSAVPAWRPKSCSKLRLLPTKTAWKPFEIAVQGALAKARRYIYVENPYLFDKRVITGLVRARSRGVDVRVILPRVNDLKAGGRSNLIVANYLLDHGVRVFFYPGMTHVKALMVDDWSCVGSGNLNHLSLRLSQENNLATSDPTICSQLKQELFEKDFARSAELTSPISVGWGDFLADWILAGF